MSDGGVGSVGPTLCDPSKSIQMRKKRFCLIKRHERINQVTRIRPGVFSFPNQVLFTAVLFHKLHKLHHQVSAIEIRLLSNRN